LNTQAHPTDRRLHIAVLTRVTTQHSMGGMELHAETLRRGFVANGHRVTTISTRLPSGSTIKEDQWGRTYYVGEGAPGEYHEDWWQESVRTLLRIHADDPFDVVASQSKAARAYLDARLSLPVTQRLPTVVIMHSASIDELRAHLKQIYRHPARALLRWIPRDIPLWRDDRRWLHLADHVTVLSEDAAISARRWLRVAPSRVTVIPNGVDVEGITIATARREEMRKQIGVNEDATVILILARLDRGKGHQFMIDALASQRLRSIGRSLRLVLVGEGQTRERLQKQCERLGLTEQVIFAGRVPHDEVPAILSAADIVALPSTAEGMPLSLLEAMAAGHPVVASRVGAIPDIVNDRVSGLLVAPGSPDALSRAIDELIRSPELAERLGATGSEYVRAHHNQRIMVGSYERVLLEAVSVGARQDSVASTH
jgi:glycosyltransferase involved in cell wall biosynthesis